jgi:hypothetical protein
LPLDVDFDEDEKVARLARFSRPGEARALRDLLVAMWRYCKKHTSDGHVPREVLGKLAYPDSLKVGIRDAERLVECGLTERTPTGYYFPAYLKRNKSRAQIAAMAEAKAEAGRKGGLRSGESRRKQTGSNDEAGASVWLNTETEAEAEPKTETTSASSEGGTSPSAGASRPTFPTHCTDHQHIENPGPCGGCKAKRESIERAQRSRIAAVGECLDCHGSNWLEDENGNATRKCDHRRRRSA